MTYPASPEEMPEPGLPGTGHGFMRHPHVANEMVADEGWRPGVPIYSYGGGGYVRQMFQVLPDNERSFYWDDFWCHDCDVTWCGIGYTEPTKCWNCGKPALPPNDTKEQAYRYQEALDR